MTSPDQNYTSWHVGMRVVCVSTWVGAPNLGYGDERGPVAGKVYTIREIGLLHPIGGKVGVRLAEIRNPVRDYSGAIGWEPTFGAFRFRPVQTRKTDISCFEALLKTVPSKETV